jgi:Mrp family chromosome partitioning ATPase
LLPATIQTAPIAKNSGGASTVDVLTAGRKTNDPAAVISSEIVPELFDEIREMDFDYCLVDAPPLLGIADVPRLSQEADAVLVVGRLDRLTTENAIGMREALDGLDVDPVGVVVIGAPVDVSPYYLSGKERFTESARGSAVGAGRD